MFALCSERHVEWAGVLEAFYASYSPDVRIAQLREIGSPESLALHYKLRRTPHPQFCVSELHI